MHVVSVMENYIKQMEAQLKMDIKSKGSKDDLDSKEDISSKEGDVPSSKEDMLSGKFGLKEGALQSALNTSTNDRQLSSASSASASGLHTGSIVEEVMDYRAYCCASAKPSAKA